MSWISKLFGGPSFRQAGNFRDDDDEEALLKEAQEVVHKANYPDDLNRYFQLLREHGLTMNRAATCYDDSRGMFERWQFQDSGGPKATRATVRFWHDTRGLDWQGIAYIPGIGSVDAAGDTLKQLEAKLALWARKRR
jgi:hypothetical protein